MASGGVSRAGSGPPGRGQAPGTRRGQPVSAGPPCKSARLTHTWPPSAGARRNWRCRLEAAECTVRAQAERLARHDQQLSAALDELGCAKDR